MCVRPEGIRPRQIRFWKSSIFRIMSDSWKAPKHLKKSRRSESDDEDQQSKEESAVEGTKEGEGRSTGSSAGHGGSEAIRHDARMQLPHMANIYDPEFQRQLQYQQQYHQQQQPPFQHGPWPGMPPSQFPYPYNPYNSQMFPPMYGPPQYFYPQPPMMPGGPILPDHPSAAPGHILPPSKREEEKHQRDPVSSDTAPKRPRLSENDTKGGDLTEAQKAAIRDTKKVIQESMQKNMNEMSKSPSDHSQPQTSTRSDRKEKKNAQSRARAAKLREKIAEVKHKGNDHKTEEELRLLQIFEERRRKKNERSRERAIEKKMEIERILAIPEAERTPEDVNTLDVALKAKQKKNEGDRIRRERIKNSVTRKKPPGVRGRPRKYPPKEAKPKPGKPSTTQSSAASIPPTSQSTVPPAPIFPPMTTSFNVPHGTMMTPYGAQPTPEGMQRPVITPAELMQNQQLNHLQQQQSTPFVPATAVQAARLHQRPDGSMATTLFGEEPSSSMAPEQPNLSMYDMSHLLLYGGTNSEQEEENDEDEKHASI